MMKTVLITGASKGIGLATTKWLVDQGYRVIGTCRNPEKAVELQKLANVNSNLQIFQMDVTSQPSVNKAVQEIIVQNKRVDVLVNNAGVGIFGPAEAHTLEEVKYLFEVNFYGVIRVTNAVLPSMRQERKGHIINLSSISGVLVDRCLPIYSATKFALESYTMASAVNLKPWGVCFSLIQPGPVVTAFEDQTPFGTAFKGGDNPYESMKEDRKAWKTIMDRGQPASEVAAVIQQAIEDENPRIWYQTSEEVSSEMRPNYRDLTGASFFKGHP